jgi:crotonobetainyl-CoA:carnitine CoA-transferase CaiB-like acyl-CoA transferase
VGNDRQFERFAVAIGRPELSNDPRFLGNGSRVKHRASLCAEIQSTLVQRTGSTWLEIFRLTGVPASLVQDLVEVFTDPQVIHQEMLVDVLHPTAGSLKMTGIPIKLLSTPGTIRRPPPLLGEHTRGVLMELGYQPDEIGRLAGSGVIACR